MTDAARPTVVGGEPTRDQMLGRRGPFFAAIWLFFLIDPLAAAFDRRDSLAGIAAMVVTVVFGTVYLWLWLQVRHRRGFAADAHTSSVGLVFLGILTVLGAVDVVLLGEHGLTCTVYVAVAGVMVLRTWVAFALAAAIAVATAVSGPLAGWGGQLGLAFSIAAAAVAVFGIRTMLARNADLIEAQRTNASLAVENERTRFARDLHDILGHSLTVITVKSELAQRLLDVDLERARAELVDLERLSRDALADVRRAVEGYRELTLPGELVRARTALHAAEIRSDVPGVTDEIPSDLRELFAWTVREGVTNVIRHSHADRCDIVLTPTSAEVRDDGDGACANGAADGHGLAGLRERAAAVGATVVVRHLSPGFSLSVRRSPDATSTPRSTSPVGAR